LDPQKQNQAQGNSSIGPDPAIPHYGQFCITIATAAEAVSHVG
jgi:hypothetical protein